MKTKMLLPFFLLIASFDLFAQGRQITGTITDKITGLGLPDVSVTVRDLNQGTQTDKSGKFTLSVNKSGTIDLEISLIGYGTQIVTVKGNSAVAITMDKQAKSLDEVVVIGYGTVRKRDLTGAVTSIKSDEIKEIPAQNPLESIQGKVAGADITRGSGSSSSGVNITIRGNRSIGAGNGPLFIVDGIQTGNISNINPNDIESVEFLKDASSTAIYGWQGANGIIIVSTKKGKAGQAKVSVNSYYGTSQVSRYPSVFDGPQYAAIKREANRTTGRWNSVADDPLIFNTQELAAIRNNQWIDYQDLLLKNGAQQNYQIGVSAGSDKTKAYLSLDYFGEDGLFKLDEVKRYSFRANVDQTFNNWIKAGLQSQVTYRDESYRRDPLNMANKIIPLGTVYDSTGNFIYYPLSGSSISPLADEQPNAFSNTGKLTNVIANVYIDVKPFSGFSFRTNFGGNLGYVRRGLFNGSLTIDRNGGNSLAQYTSSNSRFINWDNVATYQKTIKDHSFTITALSSYVENLSDNALSQGESQLLPGQLYYGLGNAPNNIVVNSGYERWNVLSFAGRLNYSYKGKYLATLNQQSRRSIKAI